MCGAINHAFPQMKAEPRPVAPYDRLIDKKPTSSAILDESGMFFDMAQRTNLGTLKTTSRGSLDSLTGGAIFRLQQAELII